MHIVCICGSMRFEEEMRRAAVEETWNMKIVVMPHVSKDNMTEEEQWRMDMLHTLKILLADEVLVIDCTWESHLQPYIGDSTHSEIQFARRKDIPVRFRSLEYMAGDVIAP